MTDDPRVKDPRFAGNINREGERLIAELDGITSRLEKGHSSNVNEVLTQRKADILVRLRALGPNYAKIADREMPELPTQKEVAEKIRGAFPATEKGRDFLARTPERKKPLKH